MQRIKLSQVRKKADYEKQEEKRLLQGLAALSKNKKAYKDEYLIEFDEIEKFYFDESRLPSKIHLTEAENTTYDKNRLLFINQTLHFLSKYFVGSNSPLKTILPPDQQEAFDALNIFNARRLLTRVAFTIFSLSGELRGKYKHLLTPTPFTWETFEQLGGILKIKSREYQFLMMIGLPEEVYDRLSNEFFSTERIVDTAVPTILKQDVPKLKELFDFITANENKQTNTELQESKPVSLVAIKALTRRVYDLENLITLLKYTDNKYTMADAYKRLLPTVKDSERHKYYYAIEVPDNETNLQRKIQLNKLGQYAALRRLEKIGELITGKHISSFLKELDPTMDWQAFVSIRDAIVHQDEKDNKKRIAAFIENKKMLEEILSDEMEEFHLKLIKIACKRDKILPKFNSDEIEQFWGHVLAYEENFNKKISENNNNHKPAEVQRRVSREEATLFIDALKKKNAPFEIQLMWIKLFNGQLYTLSKKDYGQGLAFLPSRQENKELYNQLKQIADRAVSPPRSDQASREAAMKQEQALAKQRKEEQEKKFKGLNKLREFAKSLDVKTNDNHGLTRIQRIEAAIEALENIKDLMEKDELIQANFNFPEFQKWNKMHAEKWYFNYYLKLLSRPEFEDAIDYNAAQLLQHLDTIKTFEEASVLKDFLDKNYDRLRNLRNYIEHGNSLLDKEENDPKEDPSILSLRQKNVGPIMVYLIFDLLPGLKTIREILIAKRQERLAATNKNLAASVNIAPNSSLFAKKEEDKVEEKKPEEAITNQTENFVDYYLALNPSN